MLVGTGRHLRLAAGVATLLVLVTGCAATGGTAAPESSPQAVEAPAPAPSATPSPQPEPVADQASLADQPPEVALAMPSSAPVRLSIPVIGVESDLLYTGLLGDGTLEVPPGDEGSPASWYDGSPTPGSAGPAVLLGHVNSLTDATGIFYNLRDLVPGDRMTVTREDGSIATFEVYSNEDYAKVEFPTKKVYYPVPGAELRLITCDGYNKVTRTYENNRVVYAKLVETA